MQLAGWSRRHQSSGSPGRRFETDVIVRESARQQIASRRRARQGSRRGNRFRQSGLSRVERASRRNERLSPASFHCGSLQLLPYGDQTSHHRFNAGSKPGCEIRGICFQCMLWAWGRVRFFGQRRRRGQNRSLLQKNSVPLVHSESGNHFPLSPEDEFPFERELMGYFPESCRSAFDPRLLSVKWYGSTTL